MIIVTTQRAQSIYIIPTQKVDEDINDVSLDFINETTKEIITINNPTIYIDGDLFYFDLKELKFVENIFYTLKVYYNNSNQIIYKDRCFCTNQNKDTFSINNGEYILPNIDNNEYITL
jgi:hypothetical protein